MNTYITGAAIKQLRKSKNLTQSDLADRICVSSKTVSKWETGKGLPDISLIEPLSNALGISIMELISGNAVINNNISSNIMRSKFYVCPICGNTIRTMGETLISCCGVTLSPLVAKDLDDSHFVTIERVEDEHFIAINHEMTKKHYISFISYITYDKVQFVKLFPESNAETRFQRCGSGYLYFYCNKHGLMKTKI